MPTSWALFQPLDRALDPPTPAALRGAVIACRFLAVGNTLGVGIGLGNLFVEGALHPGLRTVVYGCVMGALAVLGVVLALLRRPGRGVLTAVVFSGAVSYVIVAVCVADASLLATPLMLLLFAVAGAVLLSRRAFVVGCLVVPVAVALGLASSWEKSESLLVMQVGAQSAVLVVAMIGVYWLRRRAERLLGIVQQIARSDHLTGVLNRRGVSDAALLLGADTPVALVALDLDHFKQINDVHGHALGDQVLVEVAGRLQRAIPAGALLARVGGEEFLVLCPAHSWEQAGRVARTAHAAVGSVPQPLPVTCSVGFVHTRTPGAEDEFERWLWQAYARADTALYRAKERGRDRVVSGHLRSSPVLRADGP